MSKKIVVEIPGFLDAFTELADTIPDHFKKDAMLSYAMKEMEKAGLQAQVLKIKRFMKCKRFSTMPSDLKHLMSLSKKASK